MREGAVVGIASSGVGERGERVVAGGVGIEGGSEESVIVGS